MRPWSVQVHIPGQYGSASRRVTISREGFSPNTPSADGALLVLGADPPITGEELSLVRALTETVRDIIVIFNEQRAALLRPLTESERRVTLIRSAVADAERALLDLGHLLSAEQERLAQRFANERDAFFGRALPAAQAELQKQMVAQRTAGHLVRSAALDQARAVARRWAERWREEQGPQAEALYRQTEHRFIDLANRFRQRLAAVPELETMPAVSTAVGVRIQSRFRYTEM